MIENSGLNLKFATQDKVFTVSEFLDFLNNILKPLRVVVQGEIGEKMVNYPRFSFFDLLDKQDGSILQCFTWKSVLDQVGIKLEPGMEIKVIGYPNLRKDKGGFNFQVERIELIGKGILKKQFEILKKRLALEGYFNPELKKPIPKFPKNIGLITSKYGRGARKDFLTHLANFGFQVFFYDVKVEGSFAINEISQAITWFNQNLPQIDVLVLTRGGGSWESLKPFNSEELVKVIFSSKIPVITGIGHEDDETLVDLVADLRASTPTDAAKILSQNWILAYEKIKTLERNFSAFCSRIFKSKQESIMFLEKFLLAGQKNWYQKIVVLIKQEAEKLFLSNPQLKLKQGYSITVDGQGRVVKDVNQLELESEIQTKLYKGEIVSKVKKLKK